MLYLFLILLMQAADDIGHVALSVFLSPELDKYNGQAITVVGDALTSQELANAYARGAGQTLPGVPSPIARGLLAMNKHTKGLYVFDSLR